MCFCLILHSCCIIVSTVGWTWWDWSLILRTCLPSVLWHCWLSHLTHENPSPIWPMLSPIHYHQSMAWPSQSRAIFTTWYHLEQSWARYHSKLRARLWRFCCYCGCSVHSFPSSCSTFPPKFMPAALPCKQSDQLKTQCAELFQLVFQHVFANLTRDKTLEPFEIITQQSVCMSHLAANTVVAKWIPLSRGWCLPGRVPHCVLGQQVVFKKCILLLRNCRI